MSRINLSKKKILFVFFVLVILIFIFLDFFITTPKEVVNNYAKGMKNFNSTAIVNLYMDNMVVESYDSKDDMIEEFDLMFEDLKGKDFIINSYKINKDYKKLSGDEFDYRIAQLEEYYKIKSEIDELRIYNIDFKCSSNGETDKVEQVIIIGKIRFNWYLIGIE